MTPERRAAHAVANQFYVEAARAALGTAYHAWAALQLETYPDTPSRQLNGGPVWEVGVTLRSLVTWSPPRSDESDPVPLAPCHPERTDQAQILRCLVGNPFRPLACTSAWRTDTVLALARLMYESREFSAMPILADALQDAGCDSEDILDHCRSSGPHVRGCWVVDLVLGKE
jgi:hypothetical protein